MRLAFNIIEKTSHMNVFNKLKFFYATCHFCNEKGLCLEASSSGNLLPVCEECSRKLIVGVTTALAELETMNSAKVSDVVLEEADKADGEDLTPETIVVDAGDASEELKDETSEETEEKVEESAEEEKEIVDGETVTP